MLQEHVVFQELCHVEKFLSCRKLLIFMRACRAHCTEIALYIK